ncbi:MAG: hypothetical protein JRI43_01415 [Deltaproteobacteria bacterium]|nr:hypothetical protein [Deltaproteobacteria bacterium]MBW1911829.1 hypothetical protein [Deltaproteobacteria bacterium]
MAIPPDSLLRSVLDFIGGRNNWAKSHWATTQNVKRRVALWVTHLSVLEQNELQKTLTQGGLRGWRRGNEDAQKQLQRAILLIEAFSRRTLWRNNIYDQYRPKSLEVVLALRIDNLFREIIPQQNPFKPSARMDAFRPDIKKSESEFTKGKVQDMNFNFRDQQDYLQEIFLRRYPSNQPNRAGVCYQALKRMGNNRWSMPMHIPRIREWTLNPPEVPEYKFMNCWEAILYLAFQARVYTLDDILWMYDNKHPGREISDAILEAVLAPDGREQLPFDKRNIAQHERIDAVPGDLIVWLENSVLIHIAMFMGSIEDGEVHDSRSWIWQNSGFSWSGMRLSQGCFHMAPYNLVAQGTIGTPHVSPPLWE